MKHATAEPAAPMLHLNGSGYTNLQRDYEAAYKSVQLAVEVLSMTGPNGRDYYLQEPGIMERAQSQHEDRLKHLIGISAELEYILMKINDQHSQQTGKTS